MANNISMQSLALGVMNHSLSTGTNANLAIDAADDRVCCTFYPVFTEASKTLESVFFRISAKTGSPGASDIVCELWGMTAAGLPDSTNIIESRSSITPAVTANTFCEVTGFTSTITRATNYAIVFKNVNGAPGSNYIAIPQYFNHWGNFHISGASGNSATSKAYWHTALSTDAGASWSSSSPSPSVLLKFSGGTYAGMCYTTGNLTPTLYDVTGSDPERINGVYFKTPSTFPTINVIGLSFSVNFNGTPTGDIAYRIYNSTGTVLGTTAALTKSLVGTAAPNMLPLYFTSSIPLAPDTYYRAVAYNTAEDSSSNYWCIRGWTIPTPNAEILKSLCGGQFSDVQQTSTTTGAANFTQEATVIPAFALILENGNEFTLPAGGSGRPEIRGSNL